MTSNELPYPLFDADNHLYETKEALTKFLPEKYAGAIQYVEVNGRTKIAVRGKISEYIPNPTFDVVARPGALEDYFKNGNPEGRSRREIFGKPIPSIPAFREPAARLALMDEMGIAQSLMFPTLASLVEERMRDDPEMIHAVVHSLNQWLDETWSFNYQDRIFTVRVISLPIVGKAIEELEWVVERGAKAILIRPAPVPGYQGSRSFALPEFDPFWKRVVELDVLVTMHASDSGYSRYTADWEGGDSEKLPFKTNTFRMASPWRDIKTRWRRGSATARCFGSRSSRSPSSRTALRGSRRCWKSWPTSTRRHLRVLPATPWRRSSAASTSVPFGRRIWQRSRADRRRAGSLRFRLPPSRRTRPADAVHRGNQGNAVRGAKADHRRESGAADVAMIRIRQLRRR